MKIVLELNKKEVIFLSKLLYINKDIYRLVFSKNLRRQTNIYLKFRGGVKRAKRGDVI